MKAPRLHELTARVVAWHNRHPLAQRIDASQVHSIGEVLLPFASAQPWGGTPPAAPPAQAPAAPAHGPTLAEALAQRNARHAPTPAHGMDGLEVQSILPDDDVALFDTPVAPAPPHAAPADIDLALDAPPPESAPESADDATPDADDGETALVIPLLDGDDAPADAAAADAAAEAGPTEAEGAAEATEGPGPAAAEAAHDAGPPPGAAAPDALPVVTDAVYPPPHGPVPAADLARAVERHARVADAGGTESSADHTLPAAPIGRWRRLVAALRRVVTGRQPGLPPLRAAFSRDFIWPLRPSQVARWAQRHGAPNGLAPADWPRRTVETDRSRLAALRQKGLAHDLPLHVLTAAVGVGDRRMRVLVGADGSVLGPRAYSRTRVGSLGVVLAIGLVGMGWSLRPLHGLPGDDDGAATLAAVSASAASTPPAAPPAAASEAAVAAASAPDEAASATALAQAASAPDDAASATPAEAATAVAAAAASDAASQPQANIRPGLSDEEKYAARVEAARLRGEPVPAPPATLLPGPVYAVVGPASRQRAAAAGSLAQMKSAASRLDGPAPEHGELVENQGQWRAAWWPFTSLVDAERARVLLAGRGIKAEVVEF
jgi:hypothetical protein